jgi:energy-coupling factor transport system ATP-binding protein
MAFSAPLDRFGREAFLIVTEPLIRIENLFFAYPAKPPIHALRDIDLTIRAGEYVALVGANGSGKSTLARHLNGLLLPTRGDVWIGGANTRAPHALRDMRARVQMVFQHPDSQLVATVVEEDVAFGLENFGVPENDLPPRVRAALDQVGMWAQRARAPHLLSAGQKQRVAIAGAIALHPSILVLDEATAMLDPAGRATVLAIIRELHRQGTTIVTITHEMDQAAQADRVVVMHAGCIAMDDSPRRVFARVSELRALGLDVPPLVDLSLRLGLPMCLTLDELIAALNARGKKNRTDQIPSPEQTTGQADAIIRVEQLEHTYLRGLPLETRALDHINFDVPRGATMGLIGSTGSGKSTLMQHLNGLIRPQAGRVRIREFDLANPATNVRAVRQMVGFAFQQPEDQLFEQYVGDDVAFGPRQFGLERAEVRARVRWAMDAVGLEFDQFKDRLTHTLSGGQRRRAALAGVLALRPQILVADEPTAGLDPQARTQLLDIFRRQHSEGVTLVLTSHRMDDIAALCQHITALDNGRVVAAGPRREIFAQSDQLRAHHLDAPPSAQIAQTLREHGWQIPPHVLYLDELATALGAN